MLKMFAIGLVLFTSVAPVNAQKPEFSCGKVRFESESQLDPAPIVVKRIFGQVVLASYIDDKISQPISSVCVVLFAENRKKRVAVMEPDDNGNFKFEPIKDGKFWLVVKDMVSRMCVASIPIRVEAASTEKRKILVRMLGVGPIDSCSYGELVN